MTPGIVNNLDESDNMIVLAAFHDGDFVLDTGER